MTGAEPQGMLALDAIRDDITTSESARTSPSWAVAHAVEFAYGLYGLGWPIHEAVAQGVATLGDVPDDLASPRA